MDSPEKEYREPTQISSGKEGLTVLAHDGSMWAKRWGEDWVAVRPIPQGDVQPYLDALETEDRANSVLGVCRDWLNTVDVGPIENRVKLEILDMISEVLDGDS